MKKRILIVLLVLSLAAAVFSACGKTEPSETTEAENTTAAESETEETLPEETVSEAKPDYEAIYAEVLDGFSKLINTSGGESEGILGVRDAVKSGKQAGSVIKDISGDGIPELLICADAGEELPTEIYAVYTCVNGKPFFAFEGKSGSCYKLSQDGELLYFGSDGDSATVMGVYKIADDGATLNCKDYWFTGEKDDGSGKLTWYYNTLGTTDPFASREMEEGIDGITAKREELEAKAVRLELASLTISVFEEETTVKDDGSPAEVTARYYEDVEEDLSGAIEFTADSSEFSTRIVIGTDKKITAFKFLRLSFANIDENGKISYTMQELFKADVLTPQKPFAVELTFAGDLPPYGISYIDADGTLKSFTVNLSGMDGSVVLAEF